MPTEVKNAKPPLVLVDTTDLPREEWLAWRRHGIGGSDAAVVFGISPYRTARDLYDDKLGIVTAIDEDSNWVALEMGHLLEDLVARIFAQKTGFKVFKINKMFQHPDHPFMLADVDYFVELPDGTIAILEIKTTNYNAKDVWWRDGKDCVPAHYEAQGRHYMAVCNIDRVFFCCLYGNTEDDVIIREIRRDKEYEAEMVYLEQDFWENHVLAKVPPPYAGIGQVVLESVQHHLAGADKQAPAVELNSHMTAILMRYQELQQEKKKDDARVKARDQEMMRLKALLIAEMGTSCKAVCQKDGVAYTVTYNPSHTSSINKDNLLRLKLQEPDVYDKYVTVTESRRFYVRSKAADAA